MDLKLLSLACFAFFLAAISYAAQDSTQLNAMTITPLKPKTILDRENCTEAKVIRANFSVGYGKTGSGFLPSWVETNCPEGYQPYGLKSYVFIGEGNGVFEWRYHCCQTKIIYTHA